MDAKPRKQKIFIYKICVSLYPAPNFYTPIYSQTDWLTGWFTLDLYWDISV